MEISEAKSESSDKEEEKHQKEKREDDHTPIVPKLGLEEETLCAQNSPSSSSTSETETVLESTGAEQKPQDTMVCLLGDVKILSEHFFIPNTRNISCLILKLS